MVQGKAGSHGLSPAREARSCSAACPCSPQFAVTCTLSPVCSHQPPAVFASIPQSAATGPKFAVCRDLRCTITGNRPATLGIQSMAARNQCAALLSAGSPNLRELVHNLHPSSLSPPPLCVLLEFSCIAPFISPSLCSCPPRNFSPHSPIFSPNSPLPVGFPIPCLTPAMASHTSAEVDDAARHLMIEELDYCRAYYFASHVLTATDLHRLVRNLLQFLPLPFRSLLARCILMVSLLGFLPAGDP